MAKYPDKNVVLIGHSMGGSVSVRVTDILTNVEKLPRIVGSVVIDVVEGTAIESGPQVVREIPAWVVQGPL